MAILIVSPGQYKNRRAMYYVIQYVTRTRKNETRKNELIAFGILGASSNPQEAIDQFYIVQSRLKGSNVGKRVFHETLQLKKEEVNIFESATLYQFALECAYFYFREGYQVCFAVHNDYEKGCHIHFVVNPVNFLTGMKFNNNYNKEKEREVLFNQILFKYHNNTSTYGLRISPLIYSPIYFDNLKCDQKYYVVANGRNCGIFDDWSMCKEEIEYYRGAKYKMVKTLGSALIYIGNEMDYRNEYMICLNRHKLWFNDYLQFVGYLEYLEKYE